MEEFGEKGTVYVFVKCMYYAQCKLMGRECNLSLITLAVNTIS